MKKTVAECAFADLKVKIQFYSGESLPMFKGYRAEGKPDFKIAVKEGDIAVEKRLAAELGEHFAEWQYEEQAIHRLFSAKAAKYGVLLFHASTLMVDGEAYAFAAPSGTGKSTHARLWRQMLGERATVINDDKPFLRLIGGTWYAYGSPWNGKHHLDNPIKAPLKAVCFLEQSKTNEIVKLTAAESFPRLCRQIYFSEKSEITRDVMSSVKSLLAKPMYLLKCDISEEAARMSYAALHGGTL